MYNIIVLFKVRVHGELLKLNVCKYLHRASIREKSLMILRKIVFTDILLSILCVLKITEEIRVRKIIDDRIIYFLTLLYFWRTAGHILKGLFSCV